MLALRPRPEGATGSSSPCTSADLDGGHRGDRVAESPLAVDEHCGGRLGAVAFSGDMRPDVLEECGSRGVRDHERVAPHAGVRHAVLGRRFAPMGDARKGQGAHAGVDGDDNMDFILDSGRRARQIPGAERRTLAGGDTRVQEASRRRSSVFAGESERVR